MKTRDVGGVVRSQVRGRRLPLQGQTVLVQFFRFVLPFLALGFLVSSARATVPSVPTGLNAPSANITTTSFTLSWSASTGSPTSYDVFKGGTLFGNSTTTSLSITGLTAGTTYSMTVKSKNASGSSAASTAFNVTTAPAVPTGLNAPAANITSSSFLLAWTGSTGATSYDVFKGGTLFGNSATTSLSITGLTASTAYSMTVKAKSTSGSSAASTPLQVTTAVAVPGAPRSLTSSLVTSTSAVLTWLAPSSGGTPTGYDLYNGATLQGSTTTALTLTASGLTPSTLYSFTVKAKNASGASTASNTAQFTTAANSPPVVSLTAPDPNTVYTWPTTIALSANASDSDGTIAKVEFFNGTHSLGQVTSSPYTLNWSPTGPVAATLTAIATDNLGASTTSDPVSVRFLGSVPLQVDFEAAEGFSVGSIDGQNGWTVPAGVAQITSSDSAHGTQSAILLADPAPTELDQEFGSMTNNPNVVYVDFWTKPVAGADYDSGTLLDIDSARIAFVQTGGQGQFALLDGDGNGGGTYRNVGVPIAVDANEAATAWQRVTVRLDYTAKTWDFYLGGKLIFADETFRVNSATYFSWFSLKGHVGGDVKLDNILVSALNPLFTDDNNNGIDDAWETAHGLSTTGNTRNDDPDGDGLTNIQEYIHGTNPQNADTDGDGIADAAEISLGSDPTVTNDFGPAFPVSGARLQLRADLGVITDGSGHVTLWKDASGNGNDAVPVFFAGNFTLVPDQTNGRPVVRSVIGPDRLNMPDFLSSSSAGEIIAVMKSNPVTDQLNSMWFFGSSGYGGGYYNGQRYEDFGSNSPNFHPASPLSSQYHLTDISAGADGTLIERVNGARFWSAEGNVVSFNAYPAILPMDGDMVELVVFDHVLSASERLSVGQYFASKYSLPGIVAPSTPILSAVPIGSSSADLNWPTSDGATASIERKTGSGTFAVVADSVDGSAYTDKNLSPSTTYVYRIKLTSYAGSSAYSNEVSVTLSPVTLDLPSAGLRLWLRSTAGLTPSAAVAVWADQSGQGNNATQSDAGTQPVLTQGVVSNLPVIHFDGAQTLALPDVMNGATEGEIFTVARANLHPGENDMFLFTGGTGYYLSDDGSVSHYSGFGINTFLSLWVAPASTYTQFHLCDISTNQSAWLERINGAETFRFESPPTYFNSVANLGNGSFLGDFAEVIVYNRVLSDTERAAVEGYLYAKYGLAASDFTAPSVPANLGVSAVSTTGATLSWSPSDDNFGTTAYSIYQDGLLVGTSATPTFNLTGLNPATAYHLTVTAQDAAGNVSALSSSFTLTTVNPFIPSTGLAMWLRADTAATGTGGVSSWGDQSGLGNDAMQGDPAVQPNLVQVSGYPVIHFTGHQNLNVAGPLSDATAGEVFAILRTFPQAGWNDYLNFGYSTGDLSNPDGSIQHYNGFGSNVLHWGPNSNLSALSLFHIFNTSSGNNVWTERVNGTQTFSATGSSTTFGANTIIGESPADFAEIIVYDRVLSDSERSTVNAYLTNKYLTLLPDTSAPSIPAGLVATILSTTSAALSWTASMDNIGVAGYDVYLNGSKVGSPVSCQFALNGLTPGQVYHITVVAKDSAGNLSPATSPVTIAMPLPPAAPTGLAAGNILGTSLTLIWNPLPINAGDQYDVYNGQTLLGSSATYFINLSGLATSTTYNLTVKARDMWGDVSPASTTLSLTTTATGIPQTDTDGNGLPDAWEMANFGHLGVDPLSDPDGDGVDVLQDYLFGRNPNQAAVTDTGGSVNLQVYAPSR